MNILSRLRSSSFLLFVGTALLAISTYLAIQVIYEAEEIYARRIAEYDVRTVLASAWTVHGFSLVLWVSILLFLTIFIRRAAAHWRAQEELLRKIIETVADGIYVVDPAGRPTLVNSAAERLLGVSRAEIPRGQSSAASQRFALHRQPLAGAMHTRRSHHNLEQSLISPGGQATILSLNSAPPPRSVRRGDRRGGFAPRHYPATPGRGSTGQRTQHAADVDQ